MNDELPAYQKLTNIIVASILFVLVAILIGPVTISLIKMLTIKNTNTILMLGLLPIIIIYYQITKIINELNKTLQLKYYLGSLVGLYLIPIISGLIGAVYFKTIKNAAYNILTTPNNNSVDTPQILALIVGLTTSTIIWIIVQIVYKINLKDTELFKFKTNTIFTTIIIIITSIVLAIIAPNFMLCLLLMIILIGMLTGMLTFFVGIVLAW